MAGTVDDVSLSSRTARLDAVRERKNKWKDKKGRRGEKDTGRQPFWRSIVPGKVHLGWQRWPGQKEGRWIMRRWIGDNKYRVTSLGRADDVVEADGQNVLDYNQAVAKVSTLQASPKTKIHSTADERHQDFSDRCLFDPEGVASGAGALALVDCCERRSIHNAGRERVGH